MPRLKGGKTRVEEEGAEHISTQDVEDAQLRATLAATHVDELRAQVADCSRRQRPKRPRDVVGGAKKGKGKRNRKEKKKPVVAAAVVRSQQVPDLKSSTSTYNQARRNTLPVLALL